MRLSAQVRSSRQLAPLIPPVVTLDSFKFASAEASVRFHLDNLRSQYLPSVGLLKEITGIRLEVGCPFVVPTTASK